MSQFILFILDCALHQQYSLFELRTCDCLRILQSFSIFSAFEQALRVIEAIFLYFRVIPRQLLVDSGGHSEVLKAVVTVA